MSRPRLIDSDPPAAFAEDPSILGTWCGRRLGRYQLLFELASGGMATVYLARAEGPGGFEKLCALKRVHDHLSKEAQFSAMFLDEARLASRISHPNVCGVFDFGEADGSYYLAMEYLLGESLSQAMRVLFKDPNLLPGRERTLFAARIAADVAEGLHAAHELRDPAGKLLEVVHRDVSPQNLFMTYQGSVKVVDFGVASAADRLHKSVTGEVKGKFAYMPPEQFKSQRVDRRADVWSLGVILWELLTLRRLFRRETQMETMYAVANEIVVPPSQVRPGIPKELDAIVARAVSRDVDQRYATAREMSKDLNQLIARSGEVVGLPELADLMRRLFPGHEAAKREAIEHARMSGGLIPAGRLASPKELSDTTDVTRATVSEVRRSARRGGARSRSLVLVGLAAAGLVGAAAVWAVTSDTNGVTGSDGETPQAAPGEPASAEATPEQAPSSSAVPSAPEAVPAVAEREEDQVPPAPTVALEQPEPPEEPTAQEATPEEPTADRARPRRAASRRSASPRRPREQTAPEAVRAEPGVVNVVTPGGWAYVFRNGERVAQTPAVLRLPPGRHSLELQPFGSGARRRVAVEVEAGGRSRVSVPVTR